MAWLLQQILEHPLVIIFVGLVTLAILFGGLVQTGKRVFIYLIIAAAVLFAGLVAVEQLVVTHRERVENAIHEIARALEDSDVAAVERRISKSAPQIRKKAKDNMRRYKIEQVRVKPNLRVAIHPDQDPLTATAKFGTVIRGGDRVGPIPIKNWNLSFVIEFVLEDEQWRIYEYQMLYRKKRI